MSLDDERGIDIEVGVDRPIVGESDAEPEEDKDSAEAGAAARDRLYR